MNRYELFQQFVTVVILIGMKPDVHALEIAGASEAVDARNRRYDDDIVALEDGRRRFEPEPVDLVID